MERPNDELSKYTIQSFTYEELQSAIMTLFTVPHLAPINYFNAFDSPDFEQSNIDEESEAGIYQTNNTGEAHSIVTYADHSRLNIAPKEGAEILIAKAVRRLVSRGFTPIAISAYLNHVGLASPLDHEISEGASMGLQEASKCFNLKFSDRKIYFDNTDLQSNTTPTLIVSVVGMLKDKKDLMSSRFKSKGNNIFLIGRSNTSIEGSEYLSHHLEEKGYPIMPYSLEREMKMNEVIKSIISQKLVESVNPVGMGGLFFTLLRSGYANSLGFDITTDAEINEDAFLFGETMGRTIVTVPREKEDNFLDFMSSSSIPFMTLGHVTKGEIRVDDNSYGFVNKMTHNVELE